MYVIYMSIVFNSQILASRVVLPCPCPRTRSQTAGRGSWCSERPPHRRLAWGTEIRTMLEICGQMRSWLQMVLAGDANTKRLRMTWWQWHRKFFVRFEKWWLHLPKYVSHFAQTYQNYNLRMLLLQVVVWKPSGCWKWKTRIMIMNHEDYEIRGRK